MLVPVLVSLYPLSEGAGQTERGDSTLFAHPRAQTQNQAKQFVEVILVHTPVNVIWTKKHARCMVWTAQQLQ